MNFPIQTLSNLYHGAYRKRATAIAGSLALGAMLIAISNVSLFSVYADGDNKSGFTGNYANSQYGFQITIPSGWKAFESPDINSTVFQANPFSGTQPVPAGLSINVDGFNVHQMASCLESPQSYDSSAVTVNGMPAVKCTLKFNQLETYYLKSPAHNYMVELDATHYVAYGDKTSFDNYMSQMHTAIATLKIDNAIDPQSSNLMPPLAKYMQTVHTSSKDVDMYFDTSSSISAVSFDEAGKKLSFKVSGTDGTMGTTVVHIGSLLKGPYVVTFDGQPVTDFRPDDSAGTITLNYHHSSHTVTVLGAEVVPEFPVPAILIAAITGIMVVLSRTSLIGKYL